MDIQETKETINGNGVAAPVTKANTVDAKLSVVTKKYGDLEKEYRKQTTSLKQNNRQLELSKKENENLQKEYNKAVFAKLQLEKLCRELQRQNKSIHEESLAKLKEEDEKRKETQASFQKQINDILAMIKESKDSNEKLQEDKAQMSQHFKYLVEQTQSKQQEIEKIDKQMELTLKLSDAKLTKVQMESAIERENLVKELKQCRQQLAECQMKEKSLNEQLSLYTTKYDEFQTSFAKSNDIFVTYKSEMEKMTKNIMKLEKESMTWKIKFEKSNLALLDQISEKQVRDQILSKTTRQLAQLQKLCRTLQTERSVLIQALKDNQIEVPPMPEVPNEPVQPLELPKLVHDDKLDVMTKNCAELKQNLANLQSQLTSITSPKSEPAAAKKAKTKSKKKNKKTVEEERVEETTEVIENTPDKESIEIAKQMIELAIDSTEVNENNEIIAESLGAGDSNGLAADLVPEPITIQQQ